MIQVHIQTAFSSFLRAEYFLTQPLRTAFKVGGLVYSSLCTVSLGPQKNAYSYPSPDLENNFIQK